MGISKNAISLTEKIYEVLKEEIINAELRGGDLLTEIELAQRFQVSKTPVREALTRLKNEGFAEVIPCKGYMISNISFREMKELFQLRYALEMGSMELVLSLATDNDIAALEQVARDILPVNDESSYRYYLAQNYKFHIRLAECTQNAKICSVLENVMNQLNRVLLLDWDTVEAEYIRNEHLEVVEALKSRDPALYSEKLKKHIEETRKRIFR